MARFPKIPVQIFPVIIWYKKSIVAAITQVAYFIKLKKGAIMLAKIKTITNLGSVVISVVLVTLQVIDLFTNENNNPAITDGKTFGSLLLQNKKADIFTVSRLLGHTSVKTTEKYYVDLLQDNLRDSVNGLDGII